MLHYFPPHHKEIKKTMFTTKTISLKVPHAQQTRTKRSTARFTVYSRAVRTGLKLSDLDAKRRAMFDDKEKGRILIQEFAGDMFAMNNKCSHLGLPLQGKTPLFSAECTNKGEIVCAGTYWYNNHRLLLNDFFISSWNDV
mgnify:CR=1 FL=1